MGRKYAYWVLESDRKMGSNPSFLCFQLHISLKLGTVTQLDTWRTLIRYHYYQIMEIPIYNGDFFCISFFYF